MPFYSLIAISLFTEQGTLYQEMHSGLLIQEMITALIQSLSIKTMVISFFTIMGSELHRMLFLAQELTMDQVVTT